MKKVLILGAAGFLGSHLEHRLKAEGHYVVSVGRNYPRFRKSVANEFNLMDLTNPIDFHYHWFRHEFDEAYQLAGEVGGLGFIGSGDHDADILANSVRINLNTLEAMRKVGSEAKIFFASSQCVYPNRFEIDPFANEEIREIISGTIPDPGFKESDASFDTFPFAQEKLFSEQLYLAYARNHGFRVAIGRFGNTYGPYCTWDGSRAKAPAALCRKVAQAGYAEPVELWGDGQQTRTFTYVDDAVEGMIRLMAADYSGPVNIASAETVTIIELLDTICKVANKLHGHVSTHGPVGLLQRGSDNTLCRQLLGWEPQTSLWNGISSTYPWIASQCFTKATA